VSRLVLLAALAAAAAAFGVAPAGATNECNGLPICVAVAGPWVLVPVARTPQRPHVEFRMTCPKGYVAAGLDAELSDRAIDVSFSGRLGAPVNPGITTERAVVFFGLYAGAGAKAPSFRPHIGCMPASGGGGIPTLAAVYPPGKPVVRRVTETTLYAGRKLRVFAACAPGERLVGAAHAVAFWTPQPPTAALAAQVSAVQAVRGERVRVDVTTRKLGSARALLQVAAVCAGAGQ
jgi:hypothetical protein